MTQQVQQTINGTTATINVTNCLLSADLNQKDFVVIVAGAIVPNTNYTKSNQNTISYSGPSLTNTLVTIRRRTPSTQVRTMNYSQRIVGADLNQEFDRLYRKVVEHEVFGVNYLSNL